MEAIIRNVRDIESDKRESLERVIGQKLNENQQVIIQVVTLGDAEERQTPAAPPSDRLPDWCNVYEGLTDKEIDDLESVILERANLTRPTP